MDTITLNHPYLLGNEVDSLSHALHCIAGNNKDQIKSFEDACCEASDRSFAVAAGTPSVALEAAMLALDLKRGDEVLISALAPPRLARAVIRTGATPVFIDVHPRHGAMQAEAAEMAITEHTRAIALTAPYGNPTGSVEMSKVSQKYELPVIEDAVESFGARVGKDHAGRFGVLAVIGFDQDSPIPAAGGAAVITHDDALAASCREILDQGRSPHPGVGDHAGLMDTRWQYTRRGLDGGLDSLRASLAVDMLSRMPETLERRMEIADIYVRRLCGNADLVVPTPPNDAQPSWPAFPVRLDERFVEEDRDEIIAAILRHDIGVHAGWSLAPMFSEVRTPHTDPDTWPIAQRLASRTLRLPCHPKLSDRDIDLICQTLELMLTRSVFTRE